MPNTNPPKVIMADQELPPGLFRNRGTPEPPSRRWWCPDADTLAAYVEGTLGGRKGSFESHLSRCEYCRSAVADVVRTQRETDLARPPLEIARKVMRLVPAQPAPARWLWVPAGAAVVAAIVFAGVLLRKPEPMQVPSASAPSAPLIAKSNPPAAPDAPARGVVRQTTVTELSPSIISPEPNSMVPRKELKFNWKPLPTARFYEVKVVTFEGDVVWAGQTDHSSLQVPVDAPLKEGSYFVRVTADFGDGRSTRSAPVSFRVKR